MIISTHAPLARCDKTIPPYLSYSSYFYSRTSCEVRLVRLFGGVPHEYISTHAPLARCDHQLRRVGGLVHISTHAPLARCDYGQIARHNEDSNFYSRTSCEVRPQYIVYFSSLISNARGGPKFSF